LNLKPRPQAILRNASIGGWLSFTNPREIIVARQIDEVIPALNNIERVVNEEGLTAVGFLAYESASAFDPTLSTRTNEEFPLLWFGLFQQPKEISRLPVGPGSNVFDVPWQSSMTEKKYHDRIKTIHEYIRNGDIYQANFSYRLNATIQADPLKMFSHLMAGQETPYASFIDTGEWKILSASPELFFQLDGDRIESMPMKGTSDRGLWPADDLRKADMLQASEKERAENLMIVDMVRNDIGRVAGIGSVRVPALFSLERYPTVWQMTSTVTGKTKAGLAEIFQALFPAASVTGAPKHRAMEIISELETSLRRIYTGAIGWVSPNRRAQFSVAIRTILLHGSDAEYGIGSGIVWDSKSDCEWKECSIKARVLNSHMPKFDLLETILWSSSGGFSLLKYHMQRLEQSAEYFSFKIDPSRILNELNGIASNFSGGSHRVRLLLSRDGTINVKATPILRNQIKFGDVTTARFPMDSSNVFLYHKTTNRKIYEKALSNSPGFDDIILFNERNEVTETTIANIAVEIGGELCTPPVHCGLLAGAYRACLLEQNKLNERIITLDELRQSPNVYLMNSIRGLQRVNIVPKNLQRPHG
jgi:para-aminobenzoate synthetase/4-amino-4-deoxychorismate lyase